jgi:hypothetical protein
MALFPLGILSAAGAGVADLGSYELISTSLITGTSTTSVVFDVSTLASTYKHLQIRAVVRTSRSPETNSNHAMRINADTGANYAAHVVRGTGSAVQSFAGASQTYISISDGTSSTNSTANSYSAMVIDLLDPFSSTKNKTVRGLFGNAASTYFGSGDIRLFSGFRNNTEITTSVTIYDLNAGYFLAGSRYSIYGVKG